MLDRRVDIQKSAFLQLKDEYAGEGFADGADFEQVLCFQRLLCGKIRETVSRYMQCSAAICQANHNARGVE